MRRDSVWKISADALIACGSVTAFRLVYNAPETYTIASETTFKVDENGNVTTLGSTTTDEEGNTVLLIEDAKTGDTTNVLPFALMAALSAGAIAGIAGKKKKEEEDASEEK